MPLSLIISKSNDIKYPNQAIALLLDNSVESNCTAIKIDYINNKIDNSP